ncbi:Gfo/Idh/MocA family oxidoreductase [Aeromicrobium yanjiei]|uniref:Inositol 2-dehydrogenase n=1 Tax=Aeromicrobium yanjiei TaxID=2662028 RepID=A0A5Q2MGE8_9ACTN|nr:Gfo/Idh/MocA family oxidoreductase [Aeromicrobium yanjiei]QGG40809.1 inositol 2-dehydrogenase [Aeromicrobium yanjiei]
MSLRVGVIGAGAMGADHIRTISSSVPAARVSAVYDFNRDTAYAAASPVGAEVMGSAEELVDSSDVDAVIIASPDRTHADLVRYCLAAGKQVLCEKPLAVTADEAYGVVEAETAGGRRLLQVGFMRRYDPGFVALRRTITDGVVGEVRLVHAIHRNASSSTSTDDAGLITGSMIHELDTVAWLLDDEIASIRVESPIVEGFRDPQLATIWMRGGAMVTAEVFVNAGYGYDVRCEVVGSQGTASLAPSSPVSTRVAGVDGVPVRDDFVAHFADAYRIELSTWAAEALTGTTSGPSAWDGYVANAVAEAGVASLASGAREPVILKDRPTLYA